MPTETNDIDHETEPLLRSLKADLPALETLLEEADSHWGFEDPFYRLYHQSWKVLALQSLTLRIVETLRKHDQGRGDEQNVYRHQNSGARSVEFDQFLVSIRDARSRGIAAGHVSQLAEFLSGWHQALRRVIICGQGDR